MKVAIYDFLSKELRNLKDAGLYQEGITLGSQQGTKVEIRGKVIINFSHDDYLGWASDARLRGAAIKAVEELGVGWSSSRVISGTHTAHRKLERSISNFLQTQDSVVLPSSYISSLSIFENLFGEQDYLFCDSNLRPSLVDGIRLSTAHQFIFKSRDLKDLEDKLKRSSTARFRAIIIESVSTQDGRIAPLQEIATLAANYGALIILDESNALGVLGSSGQGAAEQLGLSGKIDIITGSFSHAFGGVSGGFVSGRNETISWLRQKSRTYLFSEPLPPPSVAAAQEALNILGHGGVPEIKRLRESAQWFREQLGAKGFELVESNHPIISIIVGDAVATQNIVNRMLQRGVYVVGFCYPVVQKGMSQIRLQISANHSLKDLNEALEALSEAGRQLNII